MAATEALLNSSLAVAARRSDAETASSSSVRWLVSYTLQVERNKHCRLLDRSRLKDNDELPTAHKRERSSPTALLVRLGRLEAGGLHTSNNEQVPADSPEQSLPSTRAVPVSQRHKFAPEWVSCMQCTQQLVLTRHLAACTKAFEIQERRQIFPSLLVSTQHACLIQNGTSNSMQYTATRHVYHRQ